MKYFPFLNSNSMCMTCGGRDHPIAEKFTTRLKSEHMLGLLIFSPEQLWVWRFNRPPRIFLPQLITHRDNLRLN